MAVANGEGWDCEFCTVGSKNPENGRPRTLRATLVQYINDYHDISSRGTFERGKGFQDEPLPLLHDVCPPLR